MHRELDPGGAGAPPGTFSATALGQVAGALNVRAGVTDPGPGCFMLTALSTAHGMILIAPTVFWGSMAYAIMGGLLVASLLTLVFLPTLYIGKALSREPSLSLDTILNNQVIHWA